MVCGVTDTQEADNATRPYANCLCHSSLFGSCRSDANTDITLIGQFFFFLCSTENSFHYFFPFLLPVDKWVTKVCSNCKWVLLPITDIKKWYAFVLTYFIALSPFAVCLSLVFDQLYSLKIASIFSLCCL